MALGGCIAGKPFTLHEGRKLLSGKLPTHHGQGADELQVVVGHVTGSGRDRDLGILKLWRKFIYVGDLEPRSCEGLSHHGLDHLLGCGAKAYGLPADDVGSYSWAYPVVLRDQDGEGSQHVLKDGQSFLDVLLTVHPELGHTSAADDSHRGKNPRLHEARRHDHRMCGRRTEISKV